MLFYLLILGSCAGKLHETKEQNHLINNNNLNISSTGFIAFGDFGASGTEREKVIDHIEAYCKVNNCQFIITLGDNNYYKQISPVKNDIFEYKYGNKILDYNHIFSQIMSPYIRLNLPFYLIFGNHDLSAATKKLSPKEIFADPKLAAEARLAMSNQINFSQSPLNPNILYKNSLKKIWNFPEEFYSFSNSTMAFFALDSNFYPNQIINNNSENKLQEQWLEKSLQSAEKKWKLVFGHFPLSAHWPKSHTKSANHNRYREDIINTLCKQKIDIYLAGHEHSMEVVKHKCSNGHKILEIISGAAVKMGYFSLAQFLNSAEANKQELLWANGIFYNETIRQDSFSQAAVLGFAYIEERAQGKKIRITMNLSYKTDSSNQKDACFEIDKNNNIKNCTS